MNGRPSSNIGGTGKVSTTSGDGVVTLYVRIYLGRVRENLSKADRQPYTLAHAREWLVAAGFKPLWREYWAVAEPDLGQLEPSEVSEVRVDKPPG